MKDANWPWRLNDDREHGWHSVGGRDVFGPMPAAAKRTASAAQTPEHSAAMSALAKAQHAERRNAATLIDPWRQRG